jgi:hypothetical protein
MPDVDYRKLGLLTYDELKALADIRQSYLIENFMLKPSINILAGDSGMGKSALAAQMAMCVASGVPFLGHKIDKTGPVIYCDAEAQPATMLPMLEALARHLGLPRVPKDFTLWNPSWNVDNKAVIIIQNKQQLYQRVGDVKPALVVIDSLRNFFPLSIKEQEHASGMIREFRRFSGQTGCTWLVVHHLRKKNKEERANRTRPTVKHDIHLWLEEAAGSLALINNTDLRLGWEEDPSSSSDALWLGGFLRVFGTVGPYKIIRDLDDEGEPIGYRLATPGEQLNKLEWEIYNSLPPKTAFTFTHLTKNLEKTQSASAKFIRRALDLGLIEVIRTIPAENNDGRPKRVYRKVKRI